MIKNQVIEEAKIFHHNEIQNLESDFSALQHKYDRKELIMQNLERKLNQYEMYITKQASKYGSNDKEADLLIKKFRHEIFSGGIESNDLYKLQQQKESKLSNIVQENVELKKQNEDLKAVINELGYIKGIHMQLMEKCKKAMHTNELKRKQIEAQDNMIKDLVQQIQKQKAEGADLVTSNLKLQDQLLKTQEDLEQLKMEQLNREILQTPQRDDSFEFAFNDFSPGVEVISMQPAGQKEKEFEPFKT